MELKRNGIYTYKGNVMNENCKRIILSEEAHKKIVAETFSYGDDETGGVGVVWGALCMVTGEKNIGNTIMVNCFTAMVLFIILLSLFNLHGAGNGSLNEAVPMLDGLERYGNTSNFLKSNPAEFALNFVQLVTISLLVNYISNLFGNGSSNNIVGKLIGRIVIVMLAFIAYGFVWKMISENVVIKWCIYAVESLITVGAVSYPIMVLAASITGLKTN